MGAGRAEQRKTKNPPCGSLIKFNLKTVSALPPRGRAGDPPGLQGLSKAFGIPTVACRETGVEAWVPELLSSVNYKSRQEAGRILGQLENSRAKGAEGGIFQA